MTEADASHLYTKISKLKNVALHNFLCYIALQHNLKPLHEELIMYEDVLSKMFANPQAMPNMLSNTSQLLASNMEKLTTLQMNAWQSYLELGMEQVRSAAQATDAKGLQEFCASQAEAANSVRQRLMDDAKAMTDLGVDFKAGLDQLVNECVANATKASA